MHDSPASAERPLHLSTDDLSFFFEPLHGVVARQARAFARGWVPMEGDAGQETRRAVAALAAAGLTRWCVPERFGGAPVGRPEGIDVRAATLVREALGQVDGLLDTAFAMQGLGSLPITLAGSPHQQARYLPGILDGSRLGAFALTEPEAGSDVASLGCRAERDGDGWVLNGTKTFISNAGVAGQYVVFANADPAAGRRGITAFVVEPDDAGLVVEPFEVIAPHPIGTLRFSGCHIPGDRLLGEVGGGFKLAMATLDTFRTTVAGAALGMARRALDESLLRATQHRQFGVPLIEHQQVGALLADSATELDAARLLVYRAAQARDLRIERVTTGTSDGDRLGEAQRSTRTLRSERVSKEVAMAKLFATEAAQRIIDRAVQIHGGLGVVRGVAVERLYREIRALRIYEGTSEVQRLIIAGALKGR